MRINKVINNNMVSVVDDKGDEVLLRGPGLGYGKRAGDSVALEKVEQRYVLEGSSIAKRLHEITFEVDPEIVDVVFDAVGAIKSASSVELSDSLYVLLTDHIYNLVERLNAGISFDNRALQSMASLYPVEYQIACEAIQLIKSRLPYPIEDSEANLVTLHIVNAELNGDMSETMRYTTYIEDIRDIVISNLGVELDDGEYRVHRFLVHVRYLFTRLGKKDDSVPLGSPLDQLISEQYPQAREAVLKVATYIKACTGCEISLEEQTYLLIHIVQIFLAGLSGVAKVPETDPGE